TKQSQLLRLRDALPADEIKVIYYLREPSELALSSWSTAVRSGEERAFDPAHVHPQNRFYNHLEILDLWSSVFGVENVIAREYSKHRLVGGEIRSDFCQLVGIAPDFVDSEMDENRSFDRQRLEVLRFINSALPQFHKCEKGWRTAQVLRETISSHI